MLRADRVRTRPTPSQLGKPGVDAKRTGFVMRRVRWVAVLRVSLTLLAPAACSSPSGPPKVGVVADSGFRPAPNGFTFQNYGDTLGRGPVRLFCDRLLALYVTMSLSKDNRCPRPPGRLKSRAGAEL
jgi:hypothetical protein